MNQSSHCHTGKTNLISLLSIESKLDIFAGIRSSITKIRKGNGTQNLLAVDYFLGFFFFNYKHFIEMIAIRYFFTFFTFYEKGGFLTTYLSKITHIFYNIFCSFYFISLLISSSNNIQIYRSLDFY